MSARRRSGERQPYNRTTLEQKETLVKLLQVDGLTIHNAAEMVGVNESTARSIVGAYRRKGTVIAHRHGGGKKTKLTPEVLRRIEGIVEEQPEATLQQIQRQLADWDVDLAISTISCALTKLDITLKKCHYEPDRASNMIGSNLHLRRSQTRAVRKKRASVAPPTMFRCTLCQTMQPEGHIHPCWSDSASNIILLSSLVNYGVLALDEAKVIYKDLPNGVKYICDEHYVKAVLFLVGDIEQSWRSFSLDVIDDIPVNVILDIVALLQDSALFMDDNIRLEAKHILTFLKECMTRYEKVKELQHRLSFSDPTHSHVDDDDEVLPHSHRSSPFDDADQTQDSACSGIDQSVLSADVKEEKPETSKGAHSSSNNSESLQEDSARLTGRFCLLCDVCRPEKELRTTSKNSAQSVILIGSLYMDNLIDISTARRAYDDTQFKRVRICRNHFVEAALFISKQVQRLWGSYPGHGFQIPGAVRLDCVLVFQKFARSLEKGLVHLNETDLTRFYNDCMARYHDEVCWRRVKDPPKVSESIPVPSSSTSHSPKSAENVTNDDESGSDLASRKRKLSSADISEDQISGKKLKRPENHFCAVCGISRPAEECREASLYDILIVIACLVMDFKIDVHTTKKLREEVLHGWRYLCKKHYIEAVSFFTTSSQLTFIPKK
ncbi:hypothetical protein COOONC_03863 [Cooperia oncophora]